MRGLFAGALFAVSRSEGLGPCDVCESVLITVPCHSGLARIVNNATTAAKAATFAIRPMSLIVE
jgi:hypothetical protein